MPTTIAPPKQKAAAPLFLGLQSYTEEHAAFFFGRDEETDRLTNLVSNNTLTIVFGKSGTGKTSLLNAGVFPRLRKEYCLPFRIRLEFQEDSPDLVTQIKNILSAEIDKYGFKVESYPGAETLWEYFHREQLWKSITPILIFDQFEEIFTLGKKRQQFGGKQLTDFWQELSDLVENSIPARLQQKLLNDREAYRFNYRTQKIKALFCFREEYLPEFESITALMPSIKYSRFRLMPMNGHQAYEVITRTWMEKIKEHEAHKIVGFFAKDGAEEQPYEAMEIEPSLLSQVCSFLDKERRAQGKEVISAEFLNKYPKEMILSAIYHEVLAESNAALGASLPANKMTANPINEFVEEKLITDEGYRTKYAVTAQDAHLLPGIAVLTNKYFIRDDGKSIELTHDVLTPLIKRDREARRKAVALAAAKSKANKRAFAIVGIALVAAALIWYFTTVDAIHTRDEAKVEQRQLEVKIKEASTSLAALTDTIKTKTAELKKIKEAAGNANPGWDSASAALHIQQLSAQMDSLHTIQSRMEEDKSILEKTVAAKKQEYEGVNRRFDSTVFEATAKSRQLENRIKADSLRYAALYKNYLTLIDDYKNYIAQVSNAGIAPDDAAADPLDDNNSLHVRLKYTLARQASYQVPKNLKIFLIPDNAANKNIIRNARTYEMYCDELNLDKAAGRQVARYTNGTYKFYNVQPGKYLVKICTYYGGFYSYTKKASGTESVTWEASPPIR